MRRSRSSSMLSIVWSVKSVETCAWFILESAGFVAGTVKLNRGSAESDTHQQVELFASKSIFVLQMNLLLILLPQLVGETTKQQPLQNGRYGLGVWFVVLKKAGTHFRDRLSLSCCLR